MQNLNQNMISSIYQILYQFIFQIISFGVQMKGLDTAVDETFILTLATLTYLCISHGGERVFSIGINH